MRGSEMLLARMLAGKSHLAAGFAFQRRLKLCPVPDLAHVSDHMAVAAFAPFILRPSGYIHSLLLGWSRQMAGEPRAEGVVGQLPGFVIRHPFDGHGVGTGSEDSQYRLASKGVQIDE